MNKSITTKKIKSYFVFLYVLCVLLCFIPYEFCSIYLTFLPEVPFYTQVVLIVLTLIFINVVKGKVRLEKPLNVFFVVQLFGFAIVQLAHTHIGPVIVRATTMIFAILLISLINSTCGLVFFFKKYNLWILIMAVLGVVTWFLVTFSNFEPISSAPDLADHRLIYNYGLTFTKTVTWTVGVMRYAGFFDEPGHMAYWGLYAIIINRLFLKNKYFEYALIVALLFTFSMGFYLQIALYLLFFYSKKENIIRNIIFFIILLGVINYTATLENSRLSMVYDMTIGRMNDLMLGIETTGAMEMDNRTEMMEKAREMFLSSPIFGARAEDDVYIGDNIYALLAEYGIVGCLFILYPFIYLFRLAFKKHDNDLLKCAIIIVIGFAHRPFQIYVLYFFIIYCICFMYLQSKSSKSALLGYK